MRIVDLRSDTLTRPTAAMRAAMAAAEVGDDVYGEDPTVRRLEEMAAEITGKAAALFVASGTMANLVSQLSHCGRGDEVILGDQSHVFYYEQGGCAAVGGIHPRTVPNQPDGTLDLAAVEAAVRGEDIHFPVSRLLILENTHNRCSGAPLGAAYMQQAGALARRCGLKLHVDGARLFNAAVALGEPAAVLAGPADSVSFCLSKGLAAPVGSLVCGSAAFIARARRMRKQVGGGMRQAGVLAAAGIVTLEEMVARLAEDHHNARHLARRLAATDGLRLDPERVYTNIVFFDVVHPALNAPALAAKLGARGVRVLALGLRSLRAVTHYQVTADDTDWAVDTIRSVLEAG
jgi:threonine aldolase